MAWMKLGCASPAETWSLLRPEANSARAHRASAPGRSALFLFPREDPFDLLYVILVVTGVQLGNRFDGLFAAFGVDAKKLPLLGPERFQDGEIRLAQCSKPRQ